MRAIVAGHVCLDLTPTALRAGTIDPGALVDVGPLGLRLGGSVANTGRALRSLDVPVRAAATIGDDALGGILRALLEQSGLDTADVRVAAGATTSYSVVLQPGDADRSFLHHTGANTTFTGADLDLEGADLLHVGYPSLLPALVADDAAALVALFTRAKDAGVTTSLDLAVVDPDSPVAQLDWPGILRRMLPLTDVVSPSADDLRSIGMPVDPAALVDAGAALAAVSAGADGLTLVAGSAPRLRSGGRVLAPLADAWAGTLVRRTPDPVPGVASSNGAGDASTAGLLGALLRGTSPVEAAARAEVTARAVLTGDLL